MAASMVELAASSAAPAAVTRAVATFTETQIAFKVDQKQTVPELRFEDGSILRGDHAIARYVARCSESSGLYGSSALVASDIDQWMDFALMYLQRCLNMCCNVRPHPHR